MEVVQVVDVSEDFRALSQNVGDASSEPSERYVRRLIEERGLMDVRYTIGLRFNLSDGGSFDIDYVRRPYHAPATAPAFPGLLTLVRFEDEEVRLGLLGGELDGRRTAEVLGLQAIYRPDDE